MQVSTSIVTLIADLEEKGQDSQDDRSTLNCDEGLPGELFDEIVATVEVETQWAVGRLQLLCQSSGYPGSSVTIQLNCKAS